MISPHLLSQAVETHALNRLTSPHRRPVSTARGGQEQHSHSQEVALTPTTQPFPWLTRPPLLVVYGRQLLACHSPPSRLPQLTRRLVAGCWPPGRPGTAARHHLRGSPCGIRRGSGFLRSLLDRLLSKALTAKSDCIGPSDNSCSGCLRCCLRLQPPTSSARCPARYAGLGAAGSGETEAHTDRQPSNSSTAPRKAHQTLTLSPCRRAATVPGCTVAWVSATKGTFTCRRARPAHATHCLHVGACTRAQRGGGRAA
jgi:hypothetical protein